MELKLKPIDYHVDVIYMLRVFSSFYSSIQYSLSSFVYILYNMETSRWGNNE